VATKRAEILPKELVKEAKAILAKHTLNFDGCSFTKPKENPLYSWDKNWHFQFFSDPRSLPGCCGVIELQQVYFPQEQYFPNKLTIEEWTTLFNYNVRSVLDCKTRRMGLITLINSQKKLVPLVEAAGFEQVSKGYNPGTGHTVTVWALSI